MSLYGARYISCQNFIAIGWVVLEIFVTIQTNAVATIIYVAQDIYRNISHLGPPRLLARPAVFLYTWCTPLRWLYEAYHEV